jgi:hypothetical protein
MTIARDAACLSLKVVGHETNTGISIDHPSRIWRRGRWPTSSRAGPGGHERGNAWPMMINAGAGRGTSFG